MRTSTPDRVSPDDEGFTLIELLVVVLIIGVLAAIAIPVMLGQRTKGHNAQAKSDLRNAAAAEETYLADHPGGYGPCDSTAGPTGCATVLGSTYGWTPTVDTATAVGVSGTDGFCAVARATTGGYLVYDSQAGGMQPSVASSYAAIGWPGGACATPAARPAAF